MPMNITEEAARRRETLVVEDPQVAYSEIRDLLERRMNLDEVEESKYFHDVEEGTIRSNIETEEGLDRNTAIIMEIFLVISAQSNEMDLQVKSKVVTGYETQGWKNSLWYYAYRALYEKFLYGEVRHGYEHYAEEKADELLKRVRETVEAR